jgi:AraC-like DNA-binding protein
VQDLVFDTADLRPQDRFDWWRAEMESKTGITTGALTAGPYWGKLRLSSLPSLGLLDFHARNNLAERLRPQIRQLEWGRYFIYREMSDGGVFELSGTEVVTSRGDLILYDADGTMRARSKSTYRHHLWSIPKAMLDPHLPNLPRPLVAHFPASGGVVALALAFIDALAGHMGGLSEGEADCAADNLGRLIAIACGGGVRDHGAAIRAAKFNQLQQFVERRLASQDLTPERAADALGMSLRQVHKLFESTGDTFSRYVRDKRLKACRAALEAPSGADRSVAEIAFDHGFGSLPTFYRAFQAAYGVAPRDLRAAAMAHGRA